MKKIDVSVFEMVLEEKEDSNAVASYMFNFSRQIGENCFRFSMNSDRNVLFNIILEREQLTGVKDAIEAVLK